MVQTTSCFDVPMMKVCPAMRLSRKCDYGLRALVTLAQRRFEGPISIRELAEQNAISRKFLEHIMLVLKSDGIVKSVSGRVGGFELALAPERITMGRIVRVLEEKEETTPMTDKREPHVCDCDDTIERVLLDIRNYSVARMEETTLDILAATSIDP